MCDLALCHLSLLLELLKPLISITCVSGKFVEYFTSRCHVFLLTNLVEHYGNNISPIVTDDVKCLVFFSLQCRVYKSLKHSKVQLCAYVLRYIHYSDVIMREMASQITGVLTVCSAFRLGAALRKRQNSASLAFVRGIHQWPFDSPHKGIVTRKILPFDDVIMLHGNLQSNVITCKGLQDWLVIASYEVMNKRSCQCFK